MQSSLPLPAEKKHIRTNDSEIFRDSVMQQLQTVSHTWTASCSTHSIFLPH